MNSADQEPSHTRLPAPNMLLTGVRVGLDAPLGQARIEAGHLTAVGDTLHPLPGELAVPLQGHFLLPGIHDHHTHLFALAEARQSVRCDPGNAPTLTALRAAFAGAPPRPGNWIRGIGYHEDTLGSLDRWALDELCPEQPLRMQHRSGALWMLNSAALHRLGVLKTPANSSAPEPPAPHPQGLELDAHGEPTGRLWREDPWLRDRLMYLGDGALPDLAALGHELASWGVTGVTDATPNLGEAGFAALGWARRSGALPQELLLLHADPRSIPSSTPQPWRLGPAKIVLGDHIEHDLDELRAAISSARGQGRAVAIHSVTLSSLALALEALRSFPAHPGDRIEHGADIPAALLPEFSDRGVCVVTQPGFLADRGDLLGSDLGTRAESDLYRAASLLAAGIPLALSSDAPYGPHSPWEIIRAAVTRTTPEGNLLGATDRLTPRVALERLLSPLERPGAPARQLRLDEPLSAMILAPGWHTTLTGASPHPGSPVLATLMAGNIWASADFLSRMR